MSHVLEHIPDLEKAINNLKSFLKVGSLVYIELPGVDSIKEGRRSYDFLGDIHKPHVYYFSSEVLVNLMARYGFKLMKSNTIIESVFEYTGQKSELINYHKDVVLHLKSAEFRRKMGFSKFKNLLSFILPDYLIDTLKKLRGW